MKYPIVLSLCIFSLHAMSQTSDTASSENQAGSAGIQQVLTHFLSSWNLHDANAFSMVFAKDADFTNIRGMSKHGRGDIALFHASVFKTMFGNSHLVITGSKIRFIRPDIAAVDAAWEMTGSTTPDGQAIPLRKGLLNFTMTNTGGQWEILVMHNSDLTALP